MILSRFCRLAALAAVAASAAIAASFAERIDLVRPARDSVFAYALPVLVFVSAGLVFTASQVLRVLRSYRLSFSVVPAALWPAPQTGMPELTSFA